MPAWTCLRLSPFVHNMYMGASLIRPPPPPDPTVGICLGPFGGPKGGGGFLSARYPCSVHMICPGGRRHSLDGDREKTGYEPFNRWRER